VIATVDNHIRSYKNVITYLDVRTCRYYRTAIHEYSVAEVDALREFKDDTLRNLQVRTARAQTAPEKYPAAPANQLPGRKGGEQFLHGISIAKRANRGPGHPRYGLRPVPPALAHRSRARLCPGAPRDAVAVRRASPSPRSARARRPGGLGWLRRSGPTGPGWLGCDSPILLRSSSLTQAS
jgi:hypothetical protein